MEKITHPNGFGIYKLFALFAQNVHKYTNCAPSGLEKACLHLSATQRSPIKLAILVAYSMLKDVPFFVRQTALLVSLYITKHLFLPTYAT